MSDCCFISKTVKTRKEHKCAGCNKTFPAKRILHYQKGVWDGEFYSSHICNPCNKELSRNDYSDGFSFGELRENRLEIVNEWLFNRIDKEVVT